MLSQSAKELLSWVQWNPVPSQLSSPSQQNIDAIKARGNAQLELDAKRQREIDAAAVSAAQAGARSLEQSSFGPGITAESDSIP